MCTFKYTHFPPKGTVSKNLYLSNKGDNVLYSSIEKIKHNGL